MTRVGVLVPLTGPMGRTGRECRTAVGHARDLVEREHGAAADVVFADVNDAGEAERETRRLLDLGVDVVAGAVVTPHALPASAAAAAAGVPYVELASAGAALTGEGRGVLRLALRGEAYGSGVVEFAEQRIAPALGLALSGMRLGIVHSDSSFGLAVASGFARRAMDLGMRVAHTRVARDSDPAGTLAAELRVTPLEVLYLVHLGERMAPLWRMVRHAGAPVRVLVGHVGWGYRRTVEGAGALVDGTFVAGTPSLGTFRLDALTPEARRDAASWMARCGDLGAAHNLDVSVDRDLFFSGMLVLLRALASAGAHGPDGLARALRALDLTLGSTPLGFGVRFDARGENERAFLAISQWRGTGRCTVWPQWMASDDLVLES